MRRWRGRPAGDNRRGQHRDSAPCTSGPGGSCVFFDFDDVIPTIRTFTVNLPGSGPGTVEFTFHGSLYCTNTGTVADKVIDLVSQIVSANAAATLTGPGAL